MFTASLGVFLFGLLAAIAGGAVGAAIGGNYAFVMTGFMVLASWGIFAATGNTFGFDYLAFGPFFGPYVAFAGGVAGAIYATYKGYMTDGKDVNSPLAGLGKPDVLLVGSIFGVFGYVVQIGIANLPWFGKHTDSVALTVLISGLMARWVFGNTKGRKLFSGSLHNPELFHEGATSFPAKIKPGPNGRWLEWQEKPSQLLTIGSLFGIFAASASLFLASNVGAHFAAQGAAQHPGRRQCLQLPVRHLGHHHPVPHHEPEHAGAAPRDDHGRPGRRALLPDPDGWDLRHLQVDRDEHMGFPRLADGLRGPAHRRRLRHHGRGLRRVRRPPLVQPRHEPHRPAGRRHLDLQHHRGLPGRAAVLI